MAIFDSNIPTYFADYERADFELSLNAFDEGRLAYKDSLKETYFVLEDEGRVVACGGYSLYSTKMEASMTWGMVHNALHKQGYGRALFSYRLREVTSLHPDYQLVLNTTQHTFPFFEKFGYKVVKITPDGYGPGLHRYDMEYTAGQHQSGK